LALFLEDELYPGFFKWTESIISGWKEMVKSVFIDVSKDGYSSFQFMILAV